MKLGGKEWPDSYCPTDKEIQEHIARRLATAVSLGGYHGQEACEDVAEMIMYLSKRNDK